MDYGPDFSIYDKPQDRRDHLIILRVAGNLALAYSSAHPGDKCRIIDNGHEAQFTHPGHIPIYLGARSIGLYGEDPENEAIAADIAERCLMEGLEISIHHN